MIVRVAGDSVVGLAGFGGVEVVDEFLSFFDAMGVEIADGDYPCVLVLQIPGMSCTREMRPTPIAPTLMRLLGTY